MLWLGPCADKLVCDEVFVKGAWGVVVGGGVSVWEITSDL